MKVVRYRFQLGIALIGLGLVQALQAQDITIEFEDFFADISLFNEYTELPGPLLTGGSNTGIASSGGITLPGRHALTYKELSGDLTALGASATVSTFFKTGNLTAPPQGSRDLLGQIYLTSESNGNPYQLFGVNTFLAELNRDDEGAYFGIGERTSNASILPMLIQSVSIQSNRWYELSATFTNYQQNSFDATFTITDYGATGQFSQGVVGTTNINIPNFESILSETSWFGGFGADADDGVRVDRFSVDFPGGPIVPTSLSIEPTFDAQLWPASDFPLGDGSTTLTIDGGDGASFPVLKVLTEFDLRQVPENAHVTSAALVVEPNSSSNLNIRVMGYEGDGLASLSDPGFLLRFMGLSTGQLLGGAEKTIDLDEGYIESLLGTTTHLGLLLESPISGPYATIVASEETSGTPPTLVIEYTLPEANGDFDSDGDVDGADFLAWQRDPSLGSLAQWQLNYGTVDSLATSNAVPEPAGLKFLVLATLLKLLSRRHTCPREVRT